LAPDITTDAAITHVSGLYRGGVEYRRGGDLRQDSRDLYAAMQQIIAHSAAPDPHTDIDVAGLTASAQRMRRSQVDR